MSGDILYARVVVGYRCYNFQLVLVNRYGVFGIKNGPHLHESPGWLSHWRRDAAVANDALLQRNWQFSPIFLNVHLLAGA